MSVTYTTVRTQSVTTSTPAAEAMNCMFSYALRTRASTANVSFVDPSIGMSVFVSWSIPRMPATKT